MAAAAVCRGGSVSDKPVRPARHRGLLLDPSNRTPEQLRESIAGLERKVEQRTSELTEALEYQTAISEVLRVISSSTTDVTPVFEAIMDSAVRLFDAPIAAVFRYDGRAVHLVGTRGWSAEALEDSRRLYPAPPNPQMLSGRLILAREALTEEDVRADPDYDRTTAQVAQWRRMIGAPMLKDGVPLGALVIAWPDPGKTPQRQTDLLKTFADQAVIAIENVRLISETREALEQQTATAEVLQVIGSSVSDAQPVFQKILQSCQRLFANSQVGITKQSADEKVHLVAHLGDRFEAIKGLFPLPADPDTRWPDSAGVLVHHWPAVLAAANAPDNLRRIAERVGDFSIVIAPMLWEGRRVGAIHVSRQPLQAFTDKEIALLRTFADQAAIAIQNARLFNETQTKTRELEAANQHKSEFLANMSHELRTPLNAVIGFSEVLIERMFGELNDKQDDYLKDIHSSGKHLLSLINDILDLAKIESGRMELDLGHFDAAAAMGNAMTLVRERAQRHGLSLSLEAGAVVGEIRADERKFKQILLNLLTNAVKFTPDGGSITVRARMVGGGIEVAVSDTGIGISAEDQAVVFDEFRQVGRHYTNKQEGTGLGLTLTKRFVELHGGTLRLESVPGQGSTFTFNMPSAP